MPRVKFKTTIEGTSANRAGFKAGSEWHLSEQDTERFIDEDAIELLDNDPTPPVAPTGDADDTQE